MPGSNVAAIILAAGGSVRFGQPKQLLLWEGRPLVAHSADTAWAAGLDPIIVVTGAVAQQVAAALKGRPVQILQNYRWQEGMSSSVSVGLAALPAETQAAVFMQIDQPLVTPQFLHTLVARWQETGSDIVVPTWEGKHGAPVLFGQALFPELAQLSGDVGGRALFSRYPQRMTTLPVTDPASLADADTPEAYTQLQARAQQSNPETLLKSIRAIICDMDGVLWRGNTPLPGLHGFFDLLQRRGLHYMLVTNNASRTPAQYVEKLAGMGVSTDISHVLNSAMATADYLAEIAGTDALVYVVGAPGLHEALQSRGFRLSDGDTADYVVAGWTQQMTWEILAAATRLIRNGAGFIGTNPDRTYPTEDRLVPGAGAQLAFLEAATDVHPLVVGKPEPILYQQALAHMGVRPQETLVIGDRLNTDIVGGVRLGLPTALMLSGIQKREELPASPIHPDLVFEDLSALVQTWMPLER